MRSYAPSWKLKVLTPVSYASRMWPLRQFTLAHSIHPNHTVQTGELHRYLRWRDQNARHPDVLAAQRRERARVRTEKGIRWAGRPLPVTA